MYTENLGNGIASYFQFYITGNLLLLLLFDEVLLVSHFPQKFDNLPAHCQG